MRGAPVQFPFEYDAVEEIGQINFFQIPGVPYGSTKQVSQQIGVIISGVTQVSEYFVIQALRGHVWLLHIVTRNPLTKAHDLHVGVPRFVAHAVPLHIVLV